MSDSRSKEPPPGSPSSLPATMSTRPAHQPVAPSRRTRTRPLAISAGYRASVWGSRRADGTYGSGGPSAGGCYAVRDRTGPPCRRWCEQLERDVVRSRNDNPTRTQRQRAAVRDPCASIGDPLCESSRSATPNAHGPPRRSAPTNRATRRREAVKPNRVERAGTRCAEMARCLRQARHDPSSCVYQDSLSPGRSL